MSEEKKTKPEVTIRIPSSVDRGKWEVEVALTIASHDPSLGAIFDEKVELITDCELRDGS